MVALPKASHQQNKATLHKQTLDTFKLAAMLDLKVAFTKSLPFHLILFFNDVKLNTTFLSKIKVFVGKCPGKRRTAF
jgi:hypothetical protein